MQFTITVTEHDDHHHHVVLSGPEGAYQVDGRLDVAIPSLVSMYATGGTTPPVPVALDGGIPAEPVDN